MNLIGKCKRIEGDGFECHFAILRVDRVARILDFPRKNVPYPDVILRNYVKRFNNELELIVQESFFDMQRRIEVCFI
jgi:hypothetical protein